MASKFVEDVDGVLVPTPVARSHDSYVVDAQPLAAALHTFVQGWSRTHPRDPAAQDRLVSRRPVVTPISAVEWLTNESGVPERTIQNFLRRDKQGLPAPRFRTTDLRIADALLTAVGRPDMLCGDGMNVRPRAARRSLTGEA